MITVKSKHLKISPRKLKLIADFLRDKTLAQALKELEFVSQSIAPSIIKLIKQAQASVEERTKVKNPSALKITGVYATQGRKMRRHMFAGRGRVKPYVKRTSHLTINLELPK